MTSDVRRTLEREVKLEAEPGFVLPALEGTPLPQRRLTSTYHDTPNRALLAVGITFRRRVENRRSLWQLKLPSVGGRQELEAPGRRRPQELEALLVAITRGQELEPIGTLETVRAGIRVEERGAIMDVTSDRVSVLDGRRIVQRFHEVEVELVSGSPKELERLARALRKAGAGRHDGRPKIERVVGREQATQPPRDALSHVHVQAAIGEQYTRLLAHDPGVRLGADPEDLHQLRVTTRRLRAILRVARVVIEPSWGEALRSELGWLGSELGPVRDYDVFRAALAAERNRLDPPEREGLTVLLRILDNQGRRARRELEQALTSDRYYHLLDALEAGSASLPLTGNEISLAAVARKAHGRLRRAVDALPRRPSGDELHAVRIHGKRARYAAELAARSVGKPAARYVRRAKALQDVIGAHQDAVVAENELRNLTERTRSRSAALAAGRVIERREGDKARAQRAFSEAWSQLDRAGREAWR